MNHAFDFSVPWLKFYTPYIKQLLEIISLARRHVLLYKQTSFSLHDQVLLVKLKTLNSIRIFFSARIITTHFILEHALQVTAAFVGSERGGGGGAQSNATN